MMPIQKISRQFHVPVSKEEAFDSFVNQLSKWWPRQYTWSQEKVAEIRIIPKKDGLCTEIGPYGFRCDWGRVSEIEQNSNLTFKWQISPTRVPEPDPDKASEISVYFKAVADTETLIEFEHRHFEKHGEGAQAYREAMDAEQGWTYILDHYIAFCKKS